MKEVAKNTKDTTFEWVLLTQTLLVLLFIFLYYLKGQNAEHLHVILLGSIFAYDFKRYQQDQRKGTLVRLLVWGLFFTYSLATTLQMMGSL